MEKITAFNLPMVTQGRIVANYPLSGEPKEVYDCTDDNECNKWAVSNVTGTGIQLSVQLMGLFSGTVSFTLTYEQAINGYWWLEDVIPV